jgi:hypothetical protein
MEDAPEKTPIQRLRNEIGSSAPVLNDAQMIEMMTDYGMNYEIADTTTMRLMMLLASAERKLLAAYS